MRRIAMDEGVQNVRRIATDTFLTALNQLEQRLHSSEEEPPFDEPSAPPVQRSRSASVPSDAAPLNLQDLADAAADIEQFMQRKQTNAE